MDRSDLVYGLYSWWIPECRPKDLKPDPFVGLIHHDDEANAIEMNPFQKLFIKTGEESEYFIIQYGDINLRVKPAEFWEERKGDGFKVGDQVQVNGLNGKNTPRKGEIFSMTWHYEKERAIYHIKEGEKKISKRYFAEDLLLL